MGKHQILPNCSLSLRLNFIFEITKEIWQQLYHKCCFFCSNSIIKSLFFRLDQPVRMPLLADCFYSNRDFGSCNALTLPISDWLIHRYTRCLISDCFYGPLYVSRPPCCSGELDVIHHSNHWIFERCHNHAQNSSTALCELTVWWMTSKIPFQDGSRIYVPGAVE